MTTIVCHVILYVEDKGKEIIKGGIKMKLNRIEEGKNTRWKKYYNKLIKQVNKVNLNRIQNKQQLDKRQVQFFLPSNYYREKLVGELQVRVKRQAKRNENQENQKNILKRGIIAENTIENCPEGYWLEYEED